MVICYELERGADISLSGCLKVLCGGESEIWMETVRTDGDACVFGAQSWGNG